MAGDHARIAGGFGSGRDPHGPNTTGSFPGGHGLLGFYMGNSILVSMLLRRRKASTARFVSWCTRLTFCGRHSSQYLRKVLEARFCCSLFSC